jgi:hypothetical protein
LIVFDVHSLSHRQHRGNFSGIFFSMSKKACMNVMQLFLHLGMMVEMLLFPLLLQLWVSKALFYGMRFP